MIPESSFPSLMNHRLQLLPQLLEQASLLRSPSGWFLQALPRFQCEDAERFFGSARLECDRWFGGCCRISYKSRLEAGGQLCRQDAGAHLHLYFDAVTGRSPAISGNFPNAFLFDQLILYGKNGAIAAGKNSF